jgi:hypothetical protein
MTFPPEKFNNLRRFTDELLTIGQTVFRDRVKCPDADHLGMMSITFSAKQAEHMLSVQTLVDARRFADASVIARVMLEGLALLIWSNRAPDERPRAWRAYSLVFDLQTLRSKQATGMMLDADVEQDLLDRLTHEASQFLRQGGDPTDPASYKARWHLDDEGKGLRITDILKDLNDPKLVDLYGELSNWIHWNAKGIGSGLKRDGDLVRIDWSAQYRGALALAVGFQSLFQSLEVLDSRLHLGYAEKLDDLRRRYVAALS